MSTAAAVAARFGMPAEWARYHAGGLHVCVDGRHYLTTCLVTDPETEALARRIMARRQEGRDA